MPDIKLYGSAGTLPTIHAARAERPDLYLQSIADKSAFIARVREAVSDQLTCAGFLVPAALVDVHLFHSGVGGYTLSPAPEDRRIIMEVMGYPFPERMANIEQRMDNIAKMINNALVRIQRQRAYISRTFIPVQEGNWGCTPPVRM